MFSLVSPYFLGNQKNHKMSFVVDKKHNYKDEIRGVELEAEEELVGELAHALKWTRVDDLDGNGSKGVCNWAKVTQGEAMGLGISGMLEDRVGQVINVGVKSQEWFTFRWYYCKGWSRIRGWRRRQWKPRRKEGVLMVVIGWLSV